MSEVKFTYPAIYSEDDNNIYVSIPALEETFTLSQEEKPQLFDISWEKGNRKLMEYFRAGKPFPESKTLDDLEVFEGNDKDAFLLEYILK